MKQPKNVRPFWATVTVDGKKVSTTGPKAREGELDIEILIREDGKVSDQRLVITGRHHGGELVLTAHIFAPDLDAWEAVQIRTTP